MKAYAAGKSILAGTQKLFGFGQKTPIVTPGDGGGTRPKIQNPDPLNQAIRDSKRLFQTSFEIYELKDMIKSVKLEQKLDDQTYVLSSSVAIWDVYLLYKSTTNEIYVINTATSDYDLKSYTEKDLNLDSSSRLTWKRNFLKGNFVISPLSQEDNADSCNEGLCLPSSLRTKVEEAIK
jgi:hypothetical protein